jgi:uncharacterized DUF497 family protein
MELSFNYKEFDWDKHNIKKNWAKHKVTCSESEEIFLNDPLLIAQVDRSKIIYKEDRYTAHGITNSGRFLLVVFTIRKDKIRIISARDMHRKERRRFYEETRKAN